MSAQPIDDGDLVEVHGVPGMFRGVGVSNDGLLAQVRPTQSALLIKTDRLTKVEDHR